MNPTAVLETALATPPAVRDDEPLYEIVDGKRVEMPPMSAYSVLVANELTWRLASHGHERNLGRAVMEQLFRLALDRDRNRRPDVAFVSLARWPKDRPVPYRDNAWDVVPDLAVEVVSPTDFVEELLEKTTEYFRAGVRQVWLVYPLVRLVYVYESLTQVRGLTATDELDGGSVLPGFHIPLAAIFPEMAPPT